MYDNRIHIFSKKHSVEKLRKWDEVDVYKRQLQALANGGGAIGRAFQAALHGNGGAQGVGPVSYTHLDVYKRQALC